MLLCQYLFAISPWIDKLKKTFFIFHLVFLWLRNPEFALARVAERVRMGGHNVPEETIRRRYTKGIRNFFRLYKPLADTWFFYDNSVAGSLKLLASGGREIGTLVENRLIWKQIQEEHNG